MAVKIMIRPRVALAYVALATVLLGLSTSVMEAFVLDRELVLITTMAKEWLFVLGTILGLSWMATHGRRQESSTSHAERDDREHVVTVERTTIQMPRVKWGEDSDRVTHMVEGLARLADFSEKSLQDLKTGTLLRDIGHLAIPHAHVEKRAWLNSSEKIEMRRHPQIGSQMLQEAGFSPMVTNIVHAHHERWDGFGYPRGLVAEAIPLAARIVSIVDVWHALGSDRERRSGWPEDEVLSYIRQGAGSQFDPELTELFLTHYDLLKTTTAQDNISIEGFGERHSGHLPQPASDYQNYAEEPPRGVSR